jgi:hypothetical protein
MISSWQRPLPDNMQHLQEREAAMIPAGFKPVIPANDQTYSLLLVGITDGTVRLIKCGELQNYRVYKHFGRKRGQSSCLSYKLWKVSQTAARIRREQAVLRVTYVQIYKTLETPHYEISSRTGWILYQPFQDEAQTAIFKDPVRTAL